MRCKTFAFELLSTIAVTFDKNCLTKLSQYQNITIDNNAITTQ